MKKGFRYIIGAIFTSILLLLTTFLLFVGFPRDVFASTYQAAIQRKFDYFISTNEPKIIIIGGSSAGFGINEDYIERETGYAVTNLGLHAGFGIRFAIELSKANINPGDIVVLTPEWGWHSNKCDYVGTDLIMSGIDSKVGMYWYLCKKPFLESFIGYLPTYLEKKSTFIPLTGGTYCISSFDERGRMVLDRPDPMTFDYENNIDYYGEVWMDTIEIDDVMVSYFTSYKEFVESKGASIYFAACPTYSKAVRSPYTNFQKMALLEEEKIGIPYISNPSDYFFPENYMYDTILHCNNMGEQYRSELLVHDLREAGAL